MDYLGKGEMLNNRDVKHICAQRLRNKLFVRMEHLWDQERSEDQLFTGDATYI